MIKVEIFEQDGVTMLRTMEPLVVVVRGVAVKVPVGFVSDGMSVPRLFWRVLSPPVDGRTLRACIVHDYLYATGKMSREAADEAFYLLMVEDGYPKIKAYVAWVGVRWGGSSHYNTEPPEPVVERSALVKAKRRAGE